MTQETLYKDLTISSFLNQVVDELVPPDLFQQSSDDFRIGPPAIESPWSMELDADEAIPVLALDPIISRTTVVAIDVSSSDLGSTSDGDICAIRGAITYFRNGRYECSRVGPFLLEIPLSRLDIQYDSEAIIEQLISKARNRLERWLQQYACKTLTDAIILFDGSLTAGTPDNPTRVLKQILETARGNEDTVIGISKRTRLRLHGRRATDLIMAGQGPFLLDVDHLVRGSFPAHPVDLLGHVYLGRLTTEGMNFRIDVDDGIDAGDGVFKLRCLMGSELLYQGYPESLRIAHIHSTFTQSEILAMKACAHKRFGLRIEPDSNYRRSLFGPFGT